MLELLGEPFFGRLGVITKLPYELVKMKSETKVRVAEVQFDDKSRNNSKSKFRSYFIELNNLKYDYE